MDVKYPCDKAVGLHISQASRLAVIFHIISVILANKKEKADNLLLIILIVG